MSTSRQSTTGGILALGRREAPVARPHRLLAFLRNLARTRMAMPALTVLILPDLRGGEPGDLGEALARHRLPRARYPLPGSSPATSLPNIAAPLIVQGSLRFAGAIATEAGLSFLGVGVQPPTPSWGVDLQFGYQYMEINPILAFAPGGAIFITVLAFNFFGDALRSALDPRLSRWD